MKVDQGSSFQKLIAGKVDSPKPIENSENQLPQEQIQEAVQQNSEAAATLARVSQGDARAEVELSIQEASRVKPEDVSDLANEVANRIRENPEQAVAAQANQANQTVQKLLQ